MEGVRVSRAPDASKGCFFSADRVEIRPEISALLKKRLVFSEVRLVNPSISVREMNGRWDFSDLLALLPGTAKGLHVTWNAKKLTLTGARVEADMASSGRSFALENADVTVRHYSGLAGNFGLELRGRLKSAVKGQLFSSEVSAKTELNFSYAGLTSAAGSAALENAELGAVALDKAELDWELFNMDKPATAANYSAHLTAEGLYVPEHSCGAAPLVNSAMRTLSSVMGREAPPVGDIKLESLALYMALKDGRLRVEHLSMDTNFLDVGAEYELDGPARSVSIRFGARAGKNALDLSAKGPMDAPEISPAMSSTLDRKLTEAIRAVNSFFTGIFPITATGGHHA